MTDAGAPAVKPTGRAPFLRNLVMTLTMVGLVLLPAVVMVLVIWAATGELQGAATWASIPAIVTIAAAMSGGRPFAVRVALVMALLAPLSIVAGLSPVSGAALMAILGLAVGRLARVGLHKSGLLVPVMLAWALIDPPVWGDAASVDRTDTAYLLWMTLIFLVGGMLPAVIVPWLTRKRRRPTLATHTQHDAIVYTVLTTVLVAAATYFVLDHPENIGGAFLIASIMVMMPIGAAETLKPTVVRVVSTVAGAVLVVALLSGVGSLAVIYLFGLLFLVIAVMARLSGLAWLYFFLMVPATAALNATSLAQVGELGRQRVYDNIAGGVLVLIAAALAIGYSNWASRHGHATNEDPEVQTVTAS